jgi:hypothetical protein
MMDIAADLLFSDHGALEYTAGRAAVYSIVRFTDLLSA